MGRKQLSLEIMGAKLAEVFNEADLHDAKECLRECLLATRRVRNRDAKGQIYYEDVPDYPIRITAGVKIIEWAVGKPISRSIHAEVPAPGAQQGSNTADGLLDLLLAAPDAAAEIVAKLQEAAAKAKRAEPIDLPPDPPLPQSPPSGS